MSMGQRCAAAAACRPRMGAAPSCQTRCMRAHRSPQTTRAQTGGQSSAGEGLLHPHRTPQPRSGPYAPPGRLEGSRKQVSVPRCRPDGLQHAWAPSMAPGCRGRPRSTPASGGRRLREPRRNLHLESRHSCICPTPSCSRRRRRRCQCCCHQPSARGPRWCFCWLCFVTCQKINVCTLWMQFSAEHALHSWTR